MFLRLYKIKGTKFLFLFFSSQYCFLDIVQPHRESNETNFNDYVDVN